MKINIYYGGRGLLDDPAIFVINRIQQVLEELNVEVSRINLIDVKNTITTLPQSLKDVDGAVLAATVEWYGIGGYLLQFLDACWLYGDKEKLSKIYMLPVVISSTYGERESELTLNAAWEILGGCVVSGVSGYVTDTAQIESNPAFIELIEKRAENLYRSIKQQIPSLPASNQAIKKVVTVNKSLELTPQESEQLSVYASNDQYVRRQKEDLQELTDIFKGKLGTKHENKDADVIKAFEECFVPVHDVKAVVRIYIEGKNTHLILKIDQDKLSCSFGTAAQKCDAELQMDQDTFHEIIGGRMTFQRAFMSGSSKMKGEFKLLMALDQSFPFMNVS